MSLSNVISIASTATSLLHYAQRSAWASFISVPLQTVPNFSDHGNSTVVAPLTQRLQYTSAMTVSTSGITVGVADFTITQAGRYRIAFEVEIEDSITSLSMGAVVQVIKNGIILTKAKARPSHNDTSSQYITTNPNGVISVNLVAGDVIDFRIASMNASVSKDITGYNIDIAQEASSTVVDQSAIVVTDQAANGYVDIGAMRMQWGTAPGSSLGGQTQLLPAPFANNSYSITNSVITIAISPVLIQAQIYNRTTTSFDYNTEYVTPSASGSAGSNESVSWQAIGIKP